jgi:hypothetical protein
MKEWSQDMKMTIQAAALLAVTSLALAAPEIAPQSGTTSAAFQRLLSLEGTWTGKATHDAGSGKTDGGEVTVVYKITAARSVLEETLFPGTPHEMVTMYHPDGARVVLTHYCAAQNQPRMTLEPGSDPNVFTFVFSGGTNMRETDLHMHVARITFVDADHIVSVWSSMKDGKPAGEGRFDLTRKKQ